MKFGEDVNEFINRTFRKFIENGDKNSSPKCSTKNIRKFIKEGRFPSLDTAYDDAPQKIKKLYSKIHNSRRLKKEKHNRVLKKLYTTSDSVHYPISVYIELY